MSSCAFGESRRSGEQEIRRVRGVNESATDPLIRFADLSPARRGTALVNESATPPSEPLPALRGAVAEGD